MWPDLSVTSPTKWPPSQHHPVALISRIQVPPCDRLHITHVAWSLGYKSHQVAAFTAPPWSSDLSDTSPALWPPSHHPCGLISRLQVPPSGCLHNTTLQLWSLGYKSRPVTAFTSPMWPDLSVTSPTKWLPSQHHPIALISRIQVPPCDRLHITHVAWSLGYKSHQVAVFTTPPCSSDLSDTSPALWPPSHHPCGLISRLQVPPSGCLHNTTL